jgi:hypothetical protein
VTSGRKSKARRQATPPPVGKRQGISTRTWLIGGVAAAAVVLVIVLVVVLTGGKGGQHLGPEGIPIPNAPTLAAAGTANGGQPVDGIQCNAGEQVAYHIHARLTVFDDGSARQIPYGIGIAPPREVEQTTAGPFVAAGRCFYWLHTHAADGIIHIESPTKRTYTLGNFFDVWREPLSASRIGPLAGHLTVFVDGQTYTGNPRAIQLQPHAQIQIDVGTPVVKPVSISNWNGL